MFSSKARLSGKIGQCDVRLQLRYFRLPLPLVVCDVNALHLRALGASHAFFIALRILFVKSLSVDRETKHYA